MAMMTGLLHSSWPGLTRQSMLSRNFAWTTGSSPVVTERGELQASVIARSEATKRSRNCDVLYCFASELRGAAYRWPQPTLARLRRLLGASLGSYLTIQTSRPMRRVVFYSWQSDLPNATNRGLIQSALEVAAAAIAGDDTVDVEPVIDRDTEGVAGSPDIASTIFGKIDASDIVVADVSIVSDSSAKRHAPNPNVLIEVGFALKSHNFERVILVFNGAFGTLKACH